MWLFIALVFNYRMKANGHKDEEGVLWASFCICFVFATLTNQSPVSERTQDDAQEEGTFRVLEVRDQLSSDIPSVSLSSNTEMRH